LGATTVLERLDQVLVGDALSTALRTSEQLLTDVDRTVLRRMAAFAGPVDIHAAEAVVPDVTVPVAEVAPALGRLVEASLLGLVEVAGRTRFRMLAAIRSVAGQRLADAGEAADVADRHADWASRSGWKLAGALVGRDPARARSEIDSMLPDLRAALTHLEAGDDRDRHIFAVAGLWFFWYFTGRLHEGRAVTLAAVRRPGGRPAQRALGLAAAANLAWWQCDYREARRCLAEARAVPGVPDELAFFEIVNGALAWIEGDLDAAATNLSAALARARTTGRFDLPMAAAMSGNVAWWRGDHATSEALYREGREASAAARNAFTAALCARHEALQLGLQGRVAEARLLVHHALAECRRLGDVMGIGQSLVYAGLIELVADERERAAALLTEGVRTAVGPGDLFCLVVAAPSMAGLLADNGDVVGAARWLGWREATMTRAGMVPSAAQQAACDLLGEQIAGVLGQDARLHRAEGEAFTLDDLSASIADL
ncbi:MAG: hypothetical protein Q8M22_09495, partial [Actinomycetota bacterium]|nr:hypothetical protein [Actinomycetota bacterium]